jgi:hypothetical protein
VLRLMERLPSPGIFFRVGLGFGTVNIVPVDFVVEAMAALSACPASAGKTYHLCDPQPHSPGELAEMFAEAIGKTFVYLPVPMSVAKAFFAPKPVQRFFGMPLQSLDYFDDPVRHDTTPCAGRRWSERQRAAARGRRAVRLRRVAPLPAVRSLRPHLPPRARRAVEGGTHPGRSGYAAPAPHTGRCRGPGLG